MRFAAIVAAAGSGTRLGDPRPKAFIPLAGKPLLRWSLETLGKVPGFAGAVIAIPRFMESEARAMLADLGPVFVPGGERRQDSVAAALAVLEAGVDLVAVHDAARPLVTREDIERTLAVAFEAGGAILARPVTDTLKRVEGERIVGGADRHGLWRAETPQVFPPATLREAYRRWTGGLATDEAQMVEAAGFPVRVVPAAGWNPKITYPDDLRLVEIVAAARTR